MTRTPPDNELAVSMPTLVSDIAECITAILREPCFLDVRALVRWHRCSRAMWRSYVDKDSATLHRLYTLKHDFSLIHAPLVTGWRLTWMHLSCTITQTALICAIETQLEKLLRALDGAPVDPNTRYQVDPHTPPGTAQNSSTEKTGWRVRRYRCVKRMSHDRGQSPRMVHGHCRRRLCRGLSVAVSCRFFMEH